MNLLLYVVVLVVVIALLVLSRRSRRRQASSQARLAERIDVGTQVMTTSGLHGVVAVRNDDDTVQLSIAPGVEVRWEIAALRDVASLPDRYRREPGDADGDGGGQDRPPDDGVDLSKDHDPDD